ncbi:MAG: hypothetical protein GWO24_26760 [Akkermansiaceae bacterium]|nr:hypothetical protein [Akkermansiaceae bacterium]
MKSPSVLTAALLALSVPAHGLPNAVGGFLATVDSPLNDTDLTEVILSADVWSGREGLPGNWREEAPVAAVRSSYLAARPRVFGLPAVFVQAHHRAGNLEGLAITFADAGSYFGYLDEKLPAGLTRRQEQEEVRRRLAGRQEAFSRLFTETGEALKQSLEELSDKRPRRSRIGKTRALRAEVTDYQKGDLLLRLLVGGERLIRVLILPGKNASREWLDSGRASLSDRDRDQLYRDRVTRTENGDVRIDHIPVVPQGYKPYCGLNTLTMAARYFGLHLDEDWLAVAGRFQNTGSAAGSQIPRLYLAVAREAGLDLHKSNSFTLEEARSSIDRGLPVVVWRRFSQERNELHTRHTLQASRHPDFALPTPDSATRDSWPDQKAPLHASVVLGYNTGRNELLFVESWAGLKIPRRMRVEEMRATAYLTFYFKP